MRDGSPRTARESGRLRLEERFPAGWTVSGRDGYSNDSVAGRERTAMAKTFTTARASRRMSIAWTWCGTFPNGIVIVSATDKSTGKKQSHYDSFQRRSFRRGCRGDGSGVPGEVVQHRRQDGYRAEVHCRVCDDDALELFKATLPSTSLMQVQRGTAVLAKRELENLMGQAAQGLVQRRDTPRVSRQRCGLDEAHTHCPAWSPSMWRYGDPDADLKSLVLRFKTPRASGGLELLSFEPGEPGVEPGDGAVATSLGLDRRWNPTAKLKDCRRDRRGAVCGNSSTRSCTEEWRVFSVNSQMILDP